MIEKPSLAAARKLHERLADLWAMARRNCLVDRWALRRARGKIKTGSVGPKAEDDAVNRAQLRQLAEDRLLDAACLLAGGRWAGA